MESLGSIVRLQVQRSSLKVGPLKARWYDPSPLQVVPAVQLSESGVIGIDESGATVLDAHHRDHSAGKFNGDNGISILFTHHYETMRERFGARLTDGIAGENILVATDRPVRQEDVNGGITIRTVEGSDVRLEGLKIAEPCVEFTRYSIQYAPDARSDGQVTQSLDFLRGGMRGFYARYDGAAPVTVRLGDAVFLGAG